MSAKNIKKGFYSHNGEEIGFDFYTDITTLNKMRFINNILNVVVDNNYFPVLKDLMFDYMIIDVFTNVDTKDLDGDVDKIEEFLSLTNIVDIVSVNMKENLYAELRQAVEDSISYKTGIYRNDISSSICGLIKKVENKLEGYDIEKMAGIMQKLGNVSGELTAEKIVDAYSQSEAFKGNQADLLETKNKKIRDLETEIKRHKSTKCGK